MIRSASALAASCLLATAVHAAAPKESKARPPSKTATAAPAASSAPATRPAPAATTPIVAAAPSSRLGWANLGIYDLRYSGFGFTYSEADFGFGAGGALNVAQLSPDVPLAVFANVGLGFGGGGLFLPLTGGVAVRYDKLPVQLLGGLGLTIMPTTGGLSTGVGAGLLLMGLYPLPTVDPRLSAQAQIQYHLMSNSLSLFEFVVGVGYAI